MKYLLLFSGCAAAAVWIILYLKNMGRYKDITKSEAAGKLLMSDTFCVGFALMKIFKSGGRYKKNEEKRLLITKVYGSQYADFYQYLFTGAQITYFFTLLVFSLLSGAVLENATVAAAGILSAFLVLFIVDADTKKKAVEKREEILYELPEIISRIAVLVNAGMILREAWIRISESTDSALCMEMRKTNEDIRNGVPEVQAYMMLTDRCRTGEVRKFVNSLVQNLKKGNAELVCFLRESASEQWENKKSYVMKKSMMTEQKLIFPMLMIFAAIILMVLVPALSGMTNF